MQKQMQGNFRERTLKSLYWNPHSIQYFTLSYTWSQYWHSIPKKRWSVFENCFLEDVRYNLWEAKSMNALPKEGRIVGYVT